MVDPGCPSWGFPRMPFPSSYEVFADAGALRDYEGPCLRPHSVRGIAASAEYIRNCSISKILEAASWKSNYVFSLIFYFIDIEYS